MRYLYVASIKSLAEMFFPVPKSSVGSLRFHMHWRTVHFCGEKNEICLNSHPAAKKVALSPDHCIRQLNADRAYSCWSVWRKSKISSQAQNLPQIMRYLG